jgi:hypothetical protein
VLRQLIAELDVLRVRDKRSPVVHLVTHAAFYASRALVSEVRARAALFAIFITPRPPGSRGTHEREPEIDLEWLDLLDGYWTVDQATLSKREDRSARGREIVKAVPTARVPGSDDRAPHASIRNATVGGRTPSSLVWGNR